MSWPELPLDQLGTVSRGKSRHRPRDAAHLYGGPYPFIQTGDVKHAGLYLSNFEQTYSEAGLAQSKLWPEGTLCITIAANIADTSILKIDACFPDSIIGFIPDPEKADARFVKYLFDAKFKRQYQKFTQGAAQDNLSQEKLLSLHFPAPELHEQQRIAEILSNYDDLIENNRRRIALLEKAARQIYREWFVRFRFPCHEHVKIIDGVPEGWERLPLGDVLTLQRGFDLPTGDRNEGVVPVYGSTGIVGYHDVAKVDAPMLVTGRSGSLGQVSLVLVPCWPLNTALWVKEFKRASAWFSYFLLVEMGLENFNGGASVPTLDRNVAHAAPVILPTTALMEQFNEIARRGFDLIDVLKKQNENLARSRDLLLPKLMSGAIAA